MKKKDYRLENGGGRHTWETGAMRELAGGKGRYDLISPYALHRLAVLYEKGAEKYADRNWEKGIPLHSYVDSAMRHLNQFMMGHDDEDHLAAVIWNISGLVHTQEMIALGLLPKELDDLPRYEKDKGK